MKRYTRINNVKNGKILQLNSENSTHHKFLFNKKIPYYMIGFQSK